MKLGDVAADVGKGLFAGVVGTAAMTVSSTLEMKIRDRPGSSAPAEAAGKVLGVEPKGEAEQARFSNMVHWGYGTSWGTEQVMLPALSVAPPFWRWGVKEVAIDTLHHLVCAGATSVAYAFLDPYRV